MPEDTCGLEGTGNQTTDLPQSCGRAALPVPKPSTIHEHTDNNMQHTTHFLIFLSVFDWMTENKMVWTTNIILETAVNVVKRWVAGTERNRVHNIWVGCALPLCWPPSPGWCFSSGSVAPSSLQTLCRFSVNTKRWTVKPVLHTIRRLFFFSTNKPEIQTWHWGHYRHWSVISSPLHRPPGGAAALLLQTLKDRHDYEQRFSWIGRQYLLALLRVASLKSQHSTATLTLRSSKVPKPPFKHCITLETQQSIQCNTTLEY